MSRVVFVGNVPYNMAEEQLIDVFKSVGHVVGLRLVYDRDTGKPKGYGFCEFADHETAASAVRNLHNADVGGRPLRIDLADSDPFLEGKTTVRGEIMDERGGETRAQWRERQHHQHDPGKSFLASIPHGTPIPPGTNPMDFISAQLAKMPVNQLMEVLAQTKAFVYTQPEHARTLLMHHPQLGYALFQALLLNNIVDRAILQRMMASTPGMGASQAPPPPQPSYSHAPPTMQSHMPPPTSAPPPIMHQHQQPPPNMWGQPPPQPQSYLPPQQPSMYTQAPPQAQVPQTPHHHSAMPPPAAPPQHAAPPQQAPQAPQAPSIDQAQRDMIIQVLNMPQEQINALPQQQRDAINQIRIQFAGMASLNLPVR